MSIPSWTHCSSLASPSEHVHPATLASLHGRLLASLQTRVTTLMEPAVAAADGARERIDLHSARWLLLAIVRSLRLCHSRGVDSRESKPVALLCYGKGTQPWDAEIDEVFDRLRDRKRFTKLSQVVIAGHSDGGDAS